MTPELRNTHDLDFSPSAPPAVEPLANSPSGAANGESSFWHFSPAKQPRKPVNFPGSAPIVSHFQDTKEADHRNLSDIVETLGDICWDIVLLFEFCLFLTFFFFCPLANICQELYFVVNFVHLIKGGGDM